MQTEFDKFGFYNDEPDDAWDGADPFFIPDEPGHVSEPSQGTAGTAADSVGKAKTSPDPKEAPAAAVESKSESKNAVAPASSSASASNDASAPKDAGNATDNAHDSTTAAVASSSSTSSATSAAGSTQSNDGKGNAGWKRPRRVKGDYSGKWIDDAPHKPSVEELKTKHDLRLMAQENLISSLMLQPERIKDAISMLRDDDFDDASCRQIFAAMRHLMQDGKDDAGINAGTIQVQLEHDGTLISAGGPQKIVSLMENGYRAGCIATVDTYARVVKDSATKLKIINDIEDNDLIGSLQVDSGVNARQVIDRLQGKLSDISGSIETNGTTTTIPEYYDTFMEGLRQRVKTYRETGDELAAANGIPTGFRTLDMKLHGWQPGNTIVVGARTGIGKSVCAVDFAMAAAAAGKSVLFFSVEMTREEIMTRFVSCASGVSINAIMSGNMDDEKLRRVEEGSRQLLKMKITIDPSQDATIEYIRSTALKKAQSDEGLDLIIIDYLGLLTYVGDRKDKQNQIADMSRSLKEIAMTMNIPIIILVQLDNRLRGDEAEEEPTLAHIRESGAIANDANVIILLHRRKDETKKVSDIPTKFIIEKNRGGEKGSFLCHSLLWKSKFEEINEDGDGSFDDDEPASGTDGASAGSQHAATTGGSWDGSGDDGMDDTSAGNSDGGHDGTDGIDFDGGYDATNDDEFDELFG